MTDTFHYLGEPALLFGNGQTAEDPHDGLALFGPAESCSQLPKHVVMGTPEGLALWKSWCDDLNSPAACVDEDRHRAWPPYPGFDVAFGTRWPSPIRNYEVDAQALSEASRKSDKHERAFAVTGLFMQAIERTIKLDAKPALAICIVPDEVYENCHPNSSVALDERSDIQRTRKEKMFLTKHYPTASTARPGCSMMPTTRWRPRSAISTPTSRRLDYHRTSGASSRLE